MTIDWQTLRTLAEQARDQAYAPYSNFQVGAALLANDGRVFAGCNVENASYGLCCCAERNAVFAAVAQGARQFVALAVVTSNERPITPCGACRQVLIEFPPNFEVRCFGDGGEEERHTTGGLLPNAFTDDDLE